MCVTNQSTFLFILRLPVGHQQDDLRAPPGEAAEQQVPWPGVRQDGIPQPCSSYQDRSFSKGSKALSSLPPSKIGEELGQAQTKVGDTFLAVFQTTPQGSHAHHDVWLAQAGDHGHWLPLGKGEGC